LETRRDKARRRRGGVGGKARSGDSRTVANHKLIRTERREGKERKRKKDRTGGRRCLYTIGSHVAETTTHTEDTARLRTLQIYPPSGNPNLSPEPSPPNTESVSPHRPATKTQASIARAQSLRRCRVAHPTTAWRAGRLTSGDDLRRDSASTKNSAAVGKRCASGSRVATAPLSSIDSIRRGAGVAVIAGSTRMGSGENAFRGRYRLR